MMLRKPSDEVETIQQSLVIDNMDDENRARFSRADVVKRIAKFLADVEGRHWQDRSIQSLAHRFERQVYERAATVDEYTEYIHSRLRKVQKLRGRRFRAAKAESSTTGSLVLADDVRALKVEQIAYFLAVIEQRDPQNPSLHSLAHKFEDQVYNQSSDEAGYNERINRKLRKVQKVRFLETQGMTAWRDQNHHQPHEYQQHPHHQQQHQQHQQQHQGQEQQHQHQHQHQHQQQRPFDSSGPSKKC